MTLKTKILTLVVNIIIITSIIVIVWSLYCKYENTINEYERKIENCCRPYGEIKPVLKDEIIEELSAKKKITRLLKDHSCRELEQAAEMLEIEQKRIREIRRARFCWY